MNQRDQFDLAHIVGDGHNILRVLAGRRGKRRVVPPAGEDFAFEVEDWARHVEVSVSPRGRSVRVWVDGNEIPKPADHGGSVVREETP